MKHLTFLAGLLAGPVCASQYCVITESQNVCTNSLDRCVSEARSAGGICQQQESQRIQLPRMGRIDQASVEDYDPAEESRKIQAARQEKRLREQRLRQAESEYRLNLYEKSAEWERDNPGQENPYKKEIEKLKR